MVLEGILIPLWHGQSMWSRGCIQNIAPKLNDMQSIEEINSPCAIVTVCFKHTDRFIAGLCFTLEMKKKNNNNTYIKFQYLYYV